MSGQAAIRAALTTWLSACPIPNLSQVLPEWPTEFDPAMFTLQAGQEFTSVVAIHLDTSQERRIALPAIQGNKMREHTVGLLIFYQYFKPQYPPAGQPYNTAWVDGLDQTFDALLTYIRTDPTGGTGKNGAIWEVGQEAGDLIINRDLPRDNGATIFSWNRLDLKLTEYVQA